MVPISANLNFPITSNGQLISVTASSVATSIDASGTSNDVMIYNMTSTIVYVLAGTSGTTATTSSMPILPGEKGTYFKGNATHLAVIGTVAGGNLWVKAGDGA
jgi:hypothetical protein